MRYDKLKAVAVMLLGLAGILIAFSFAIYANSDKLVTPPATPELALDAQRLMIQLSMASLIGGCAFLYWGADQLGRAKERENEDKQYRKRKSHA